MNILFPIAGLGSRFKENGYVDPKPFVKFKGKSLLEWSLSSLRLPGKYYVIVNNLPSNYIEEINVIKNKYYLDLEIVDIKTYTKGQAETCLLGINKANIDLEDELVITNCDQFTPWNVNKFLKFIKESDCSGVVTTYNHKNFKLNEKSVYSHIEIDENGCAKRLEEKHAISSLALNGIFYYRNANLFVYAANKLLESDVLSSDKSGSVQEKYVSLTYNFLINNSDEYPVLSNGLKVKHYPMEDNEFVSLGSPEEIYLHIKSENVKKAVEDLKSGKPIVMVDDYDREFEGDIVLAAEKVTEENLLFAMRHARGLMCLPCTQEKLDQFNIPMMNCNGADKYGTPFATSIDAVEGATTGMSVSDRLATIKTFLSNVAKPEQLAQPGHLFPLRARPGLLSERRGHTEGCVEILKYAGMEPVGIIIEIMDECGKMIKGDALLQFAQIYNLTFISIEELYNAVYNADDSIPLSSVTKEMLEQLL